MAKWKPTFYRTNGKPGAVAPLRKFARKLLENMKHRNEELGNYANPVHRFQYDGNKFFFQSLPGYDIVHITVPHVDGDEEKQETAEVYSGCWEPRFHVSGLFGWFMRWFPSAYEVFNSETDTEPPGLGASVDGAAEELTNPLPPARWMYSDYDNTRMETPWFDDIGGEVTYRRFHPGRYSGKLRELAQMQLGYGLLPEFGYTASNSSGIYLETLDEDTTRIWLIWISGTNGIVKQIIGDYSLTRFEAEQDLGAGGIPPEVEAMGWFSTQTSFDITRPVYTKADWDALPEDEQPVITSVTFQMLPAADYSAAVAGYSAHGDYGWSFNPDGTSAVLVGLGWNTPSGGGLAVNYQSKSFAITFNHHTYAAAISDTGKQVFLMDSIYSQVKWPDEYGLLNTAYYFKGQNGNKGTHPSNSYTVPIYTYYDLQGQQVTCEYTYNAGTYEDRNAGKGRFSYDEVIACRERVTWHPDIYTYHNCGIAKKGLGTYGALSGFTTSITTTDSTDNFNGTTLKFSSTDVLCSGNNFIESHKLQLYRYPTEGRAAGMHADSQYLAMELGNFVESTESVLIIPSYERLGFYHYKSHTNSVTAGQLLHPEHWIYEHGTPVRWHGDGSIGQDGCEFGAQSCGGFGAYGNREPGADTAGYYYAWDGQADVVWPVFIACASGTGNDCFVGDEFVVSRPTPPDENPYTRVTTSLTGGLMLPDGNSVAFSEDEIANQSEPFRESSEDFGKQSVISCFDTFSGKYIYSMPDVALTPRKHSADGFPDDFVRRGVLFSGMPYFSE